MSRPGTSPQKSKQLPTSKGTILVSYERVVLGIKSKVPHGAFTKPSLATGQEVVTNLLNEILVFVARPEDVHVPALLALG